MLFTFEGITKLLEYFDFLVVLLELVLCELDGDHESAVGLGFGEEFGVKFNELAEFRRAQLSTNF